MDEDDGQIDWSLLPHSPHAFFGVAKDFDRKELKRKYNRLIRQFKPERFPAEFQKIRAAYEVLDNQLRYGEQVIHFSDLQQQYQWQTDETSKTKPAEKSSHEKAPSPGTGAKQDSPSHELNQTLRDQIRQEPLADVYQKLVKKPKKLPYDYYALAVMSDIVVRKDGLQFVQWILQGLLDHSHDRGLTCLLYEYLRGPVPDQAISSLLIATSNVIRDDSFYAITEPLWQKFLRQRPFAEFRSTQDKCNANLRDIGIDCRLAFSIEILKSAMWVADQDWIETTSQLIEENFERIPYHLQFDTDMLEMMKRYVLDRARFVASSPMRKLIDQAMNDYFTKDQTEGDRSVLQCQVSLAENPGAVLQAFSVASDEDFSNLYILWNFVTSDVTERHLTEVEKPVDVDAWISRGRALYDQIENGSRSRYAVKGGVIASFLYSIFISFVYLVVVLLVCLGLLIGALELGFDNDGVMFAILVGSIAGGLFLAHALHRRYLTSWWEKYESSKVLDCYESVARIALIEFLQRSQFSYSELRQLLFSCNITGLSWAQTTADRFQQDYGLVFYSIALRFMV